MVRSNTGNTIEKTAKSIRFNKPTRSDKAEFNAEANFTFHTNGVTVYFNRIREEPSGYIFVKHDAEVAYVKESECDISPKVAKTHAEDNPNENIPFADPIDA